MLQVLLRASGLAALQFGVGRQDCEPRLGRVVGDADRCARIGQKEPGSLLVVAKHLGDELGPACKELCC